MIESDSKTQFLQLKMPKKMLMLSSARHFLPLESSHSHQIKSIYNLISYYPCQCHHIVFEYTEWPFVGYCNWRPLKIRKKGLASNFDHLLGYYSILSLELGSCRVVMSKIHWQSRVVSRCLCRYTLIWLTASGLWAENSVTMAFRIRKKKGN